MGEREPIHPGEILGEEFLDPLEITAHRLSQDIGMTRAGIGRILEGSQPITAGTALRLGRYFDMEARFWVNLQAHYDLQRAEAITGPKLDAEVRPLERA